MTERATVEEKSPQTAGERSTLFLTWKLDPTTGKLVARWTSEQSAKTASSALRPAA